MTSSESLCPRPCEAWILTLFVCLALTVLAPTGVLGQDTIEIAQNAAWVDFPQAADFHLVATATVPIARVQIEYGVDALACGDVTTVATPEFESSAEIDVTWRWQIAPDRIVPPGGRIWWRWRLITIDKAEIVTEAKTISFDDDWFVWQSLSDRNITVHWYRGTESLARDMLDAGHQALISLATDTGLLITDPIAVYLYEEPFDLKVTIPGAPDWIGGIAFPEHNIVLAVANESYTDYGRQTVRHELGHVVIRRFTFNCLSDIPVWLDEGLAMVAEGEDPNVAETLDEAIAENNLLTIRQIESSFSVHADRAKLSYAESYSLVRFLVDTYGQEKMIALLEAFREGVTPDDALTSVYGFGTEGLESEWRVAIGAPPVDDSAVDEPDSATPIPTLALAILPSIEPTVVTAPTPTPIGESRSTESPTATAATSDDDIAFSSWLAWIGGGLALIMVLGLVVWRISRR